MSTLVGDIETDGLMDELTRIWCLSVGDPHTEVIDTYADQPGYAPLSEGLERISKADRVVFHNGLAFDWPVIEKLYPGTLRFEQVYDTLVVSRLKAPHVRAHALDDWGKRLGHAKPKHEDWTRFSEDMVHRNREDVAINIKVFKKLWKATKSWGESVALEHQVKVPIFLTERNGFRLNVREAQELEAELRQEQTDIERELQGSFESRWVAIKEGSTVKLYPWWHKREIKKGLATKVPKKGKPTGKSKYVAGAPFTRVEYLDFNPGSRNHIEAWLRMSGWVPRVFTDAGAAKLDDKVLGEIAVLLPKAEPLARYFRVGKQLGQLADGKNAWLKKVTPEGRVHGRINPNGAHTGRMSHFNPNLAQVDKKDLRMRAVWIPRAGWKLVGADAEGIELRMLGHYLYPYDNGEFARRVVEGDKDEGTDAHTINRNLIGLYIRDNAKRTIYAMIYGAGDAKLGLIILEDAKEAGKLTPEESPNLFKKNGKRRSPTELGKAARNALMKGITGLQKLVSKVKSAHSKNGYIRSLDGRKIYTRSGHSALNSLLQSGGGIIMKKALAIFHFEKCVELGLVFEDQWLDTYHFAYCANVHDEVQNETEPDWAVTIGDAFSECITRAGEALNVRVPMAGKSDVGDSWKETH